MAGDAAGQITASLTLDISNFQKAIKQAQGALDKLNGTSRRSSGGGGGASKPKLPGADQKTVKAIKETIKNVKSLSDQIRANKTTTDKAKQALAGYEKSLERLGAAAKRDTEEFRQFNRGIAAVGGMKSFINVSDTASSKMSKLTSQVESGGSKMSNVFAAMSTGGAGAMRATVMSFTNITEAFQKGLMGGRQFAMFFMGDLSDAMMIGSFHASGFAKAAAAASGSTKTLLLGMAKWVMPAQVAITALMGVLGLAAAKMGWFGAKTKKAKEETAKATVEFRRAADELTILESEVSMVGVAFAGFVKRANALEGININKALDPMEALVEVSNRLNAIKFGKFGVQFLQIANFISMAREEVEQLRADFLDLQANMSTGDARAEALEKQREMVAEMKKQAELREQLSKTSNIINAFNIVGQIRDAEARINDLRESRNKIVQSGIDDEERLKAIGERIVAQELILIKAKKDRLKFQKEIVKLKQAEKAAEDAKKKKEDPVLKFFTDSMKEAIDQAKILQEKINSLYDIIKKAPKGEQAGLLKSLGVKDAEAQLKKIEKRQAQLVKKGAGIDPEIGSALKDMKHAADLQQKAKQDAKIQAREYEKIKEAMIIASRASGLGINVTSQQVYDMDASQRKSLEGRMSERQKVFDFLSPLIGGAENVLVAFNGMSSFAREIPGFSRAAEEGLVQLGVAAMTAASAMTEVFGQAAMGNFGSFMSGALGAVGAGAGVAAGIDPATGQAIGQALGGFADMVIGRMEVTSDVVDPNTGEKIIAPMMALFEQEFNDALRPALKAFEPFGKLVFYVATRLGLLLGKLSEALTPLIDLIGTLLMSVFQIFYIQIMAMVPLMAAYVSVLQLLIPVIEFLNQGIVLLGNAMAQFAIWVGWLINEFAKLIEDIPLIGEGLHAALNGMGDALISGATEFATSLVSSLDDLNPEIQAAANQYAQQNENMAKANKEASKVLNAPQGFKIEKYRYEAMNREGMTNPYTGAPLNQNNVNIYGAVTVIADSPEDFMTRMQNNANRVGSINPQFGG